MSLDFNNHHIIVTGGLGTLGTAVSEALLKAGARCSIPAHSPSAIENFHYADHRNCFIKTNINLSDEEDTQQFFNDAVSRQGPLWASIHIAGGFGTGSIEETDQAAFTSQFQLNTVTCFNSCRAAVYWMRNADHGGGRIVNVAARPGLEPRKGKGMTAYTVSKAGVWALTQALAEEVMDDGILVNAIAPSIFDTPQNRASMPNADFDQWQKPKQVAQQVIYLASDMNEVTQGAVIPVYGSH